MRRVVEFVGRQGTGRKPRPICRLEIAEPQGDGIGRVSKDGNGSATLTHLQRTADFHLARPPGAKIKLPVGALDELDARRAEPQPGIRLGCRFGFGRAFIFRLRRFTLGS